MDLNRQRLLDFFQKNSILFDEEDVDKIVAVSSSWSLLVRDADTRVTAWYDSRTVYLHRIIMDCPEHLVVDHANGNPLDNRKENLRICTQAENCRNRKPNRNKEFKGLSKRPNGKWRVRVSAHGMTVHVGDFLTEKEAAYAYNRYALLLHANFVKINEI